MFVDRVQVESTTTGTGDYTLGAALTGFRAFSDGTWYYCATDGVDWEVGQGTVSGTTLARTTVLESSNAGAAVNWGAGIKRVFATAPAAAFESFADINHDHDADYAPLVHTHAVADLTGGTAGQLLRKGSSTPEWYSLHKCGVRRAASQAIAAGVATKISFDTTDFNTGFTISGGDITVNRGGTFMVIHGWGPDQDTNAQLQVLLNGGALQRMAIPASASGGVTITLGPVLSVARVHTLAVSDVLTMNGFLAGGGNTSTVADRQPFLIVLELP